MSFGFFEVDSLISSAIDIFVIFIALIAFSCAIWLSNKKNGSLENENLHMQNLEKTFNSAVWGVVFYLASLPFQMMLWLGAVTLTRANPVWHIPSMIMVAISLLAAILIWALLPLLRLGYALSVAGAVTINQYMKHEYPLEFAKSSKLLKPFRRKV